MIFLVIVGLLVAIAVLAVRYLKINANVLSKDTFTEEAQKRADRMKHEDPVITCDYCGAKINTVYDMRCPNCGASYERDQEWLDRYNVDLSRVEEEADEFAESKKREAWRESRETARKLKKTSIALGVIVGALVLLIAIAAIIVAVSGMQYDYAESEELNEYSFEQFEKTADSFTPAIILDECGVRVTLTGIYRDAEEEAFKLEYVIENTSNEPRRVYLDLCGMNGVTLEYGSLFEWVRKGDTVTLYSEVSDVPGETVSEVIYEERWVCDKNEDIIFRDESLLRVPSGAPQKFDAEGEGELLYDDHDVRIFYAGMEDDRYLFCVENNSGIDYRMSSTDLRVNGVESDSAAFYHEAVPAGYLYRDNVWGYGDVFENLSTSDRLSLSLQFSCEADPSKDFSTQYLEFTPDP